jgi:hypothetical protein
MEIFGTAHFDAFKLLDTHGVPLAVQIEENRKRGRATSLPKFYLDAIKAGWSKVKIISVITEAMQDTGASSEEIEQLIAWLRMLPLTGVNIVGVLNEVAPVGETVQREVTHAGDSVGGDVLPLAPASLDECRRAAEIDATLPVGQVFSHEDSPFRVSKTRWVYPGGHVEEVLPGGILATYSPGPTVFRTVDESGKVVRVQTLDEKQRTIK